MPCASAASCCQHSLAGHAGCSPASRPSSWPQKHPHALSGPDQSRQCCQQHVMSTADEEAICSTRLILPILSLVMQAPACKARTNHMCLETYKIPMLAMYSQSDNAFTGPWHKYLSHCCVFIYLNIMLEKKERQRHGACNSCTLQHRTTVTSFCQQQLTNQQSMTQLVAKQTDMVGANRHGDAAGHQHRTLYSHAYDTMLVCYQPPQRGILPAGRISRQQILPAAHGGGGGDGRG